MVAQNDGRQPSSPAVKAFRTSVEKLPKKSPSGEYRLDLVDSEPPDTEPGR